MIENMTPTELDDPLYEPESRVEEPTEDFVTFRLGREWFAVRITNVREVLTAGRLTFLPSAPSHVAGILNVRGNIVSAIDPRQLFGLPTAPAAESRRVLVIESAATETGLLVDEVGEVLSVPQSQLEPPFLTLDATQPGYIEHTCRWRDRLIAIVKAEKFLSRE